MIRPISSFGFATIAPAGFYIALRVGFAYPMAEHNTFPEEWVDDYTSGGLMIYDPVMRWVYENTGAIRWSEIELDDPREVLRRAAGHGLVFGVAVSCADENGGGQRSFGHFARSDRELNDREVETLASRMKELHGSAVPPAKLTDAELEALRLVKNGMLLKQIAVSLGVSEGAIKQRLKNAKDKLSAKNSTQAATIAMEYGLI